MDKSNQSKTGALLEEIVEMNLRCGNQAAAHQAEELLEEDILPETALPTEICYSEEERVILYPVDKSGPKEGSIEDFCQRRYDARSLEKIRLTLRLDALRDLPHVDLVDMPGFESGVEQHDRILDSSAVVGSAYLLVFSAEEAVVRETMVHILRELRLREGVVPLCVVVTKAKRRIGEDLEDVVEDLRRGLQKYIKEEFELFEVDRDDPRSVEPVHDFLRALEEQRPALVDARYWAQAAAMADELRLYLRKRKGDLELSQSELEEQEAALEQALTNLEQSRANEREQFERSIPDCQAQILADVEQTLHRREGSYVQKMLKGISPAEQLNADVRQTVVTSLKSHFEPRVEAYARQIQSDLRAAALCLMSEQQSPSAGLALGVGAGLAAGGTAALLGGGSTAALTSFSSGLAATLGSSVVALSLPVIGLIIGGIAALAGALIAKARREEQRQAYEQQLRTQVFPQILEELRQKLEIELAHAVQKANEAIDAEVTQKTQMLRENLAKVTEERQQEEQEVCAEREQAQAQLEEWEEVCHGYGC